MVLKNCVAFLMLSSLWAHKMKLMLLPKLKNLVFQFLVLLTPMATQNQLTTWFHVMMTQPKLSTLINPEHEMLSLKQEAALRLWPIWPMMQLVRKISMMQWRRFKFQTKTVKTVMIDALVKSELITVTNQARDQQDQEEKRKVNNGHINRIN